jgi:hypothetical protein
MNSALWRERWACIIRSPHPAQANGSDEIAESARYEVGSGTFSVPGRSVAVFRQDADEGGATGGGFPAAPFSGLPVG